MLYYGFFSEVRVTEYIDCEALKSSGVEIFGGEVRVERGCELERGVKIYAPAYIAAGTHLRGGAIVYPFSFISASYVGENTVVFSSTLTGAHVGHGCRIGPYAYLRDGAIIGDGCRIGDFVEVKASVMGNGCKAAHLAYVGDAELGENVNVGCGAVFANYDGKVKQKTSVGDGCFIGCNCNLIAPVNLAAGAYVAAGTTLTRDLNELDFCIGRQREKIVPHGAAGRYSGQK